MPASGASDVHALLPWRVRLFFALCHCSLFALLSALSYAWAGYDVLSCGLIFCAGPVSQQDFDERPFQNGFYPWVGATLCTVSATVAIGEGARAVSALLSALEERKRACIGATDDSRAHRLDAGTTDEASAKTAHHTGRLSRTLSLCELAAHHRRLGCGIFFGVALPLLWVVASLAPNSWEWWTGVGYRIWVAQEISTPSGLTTECTIPAHSSVHFGSSPKVYPCPEHPNSTLLTGSWRVSTNVAFKAFPDVVLWYSSFFVASLVGVVSTHVPQLRRAMHTPLPWGRKRWQRAGFTSPAPNLGQLLACGFLATFAALWVVYWFYDHDYHNNEAKKKYKMAGVYAVENAARGSGQVGNMLLGLLSLPVARNSVWAEVFGVDWASTISLHRILGRALLLTLFLHMVLW